MAAINITVKSLRGSSVDTSISLPSTATGRELKSAVAARTGVAEEEQKLMHRGKALQDGSSLDSQNVKSGDKIHLMVTPTKVPSEAAPVPEVSTELSQELKIFLRPHFAEQDSKKIIDHVHKDVFLTAAKLSLDQIERIAAARLQKSQ